LFHQRPTRAKEYATRDCSTIDLCVVPVPQGKDVLTEVLRQGAETFLAQAIEAEVAAWIDGHAHLRDEAGHRQVVRNGAMPVRTITTGVGPVEARGGKSALVEVISAG
jgi:hypothetical protein